MRIAIFGTTELKTFPELADISRRHTVIPFLAEGEGDLRGWQNELRHSSYDMLHFALHIARDTRGWPSQLLIEDGTIGMEDVVAMAKLANARGLFFNSCDSAMIANYAVRNGVPGAIYTTADLADREAWKYPMLYYEQLARQEDEGLIIDLRKAFEQTVDRGGFYGWASNGLYERSLLSPLVDEIGKVYESMAEHTDRVNASLLAYEAKLALVTRQIRTIGITGGLLMCGGILFNTALMVAQYFNL